jgi:hypothetical protein
MRKQDPAAALHKNASCPEFRRICKTVQPVFRIPPAMRFVSWRFPPDFAKQIDLIHTCLALFCSRSAMPFPHEGIR